MLPMEFLGVKRREQETKARELLYRVGIDSDHQSRHPPRLSGGEQQRVAIARVLANAPPVILADEPTGNLDSETGLLIVELLHGLSQEGRTVVVVTHDVAVAAKADIILGMKDGKITVEGST